ncbi:MAG: hypothetical protein IT381_22895 [Deltaproteobacteria bacterium]|nr:hypothetical protein [Deltaproteobacteria bacterium]
MPNIGSPAPTTVTTQPSALEQTQAPEAPVHAEGPAGAEPAPLDARPADRREDSRGQRMDSGGRDSALPTGDAEPLPNTPRDTSSRNSPSAYPGIASLQRDADNAILEDKGGVEALVKDIKLCGKAIGDITKLIAGARENMQKAAGERDKARAEAVGFREEIKQLNPKSENYESAKSGLEAKAKEADGAAAEKQAKAEGFASFIAQQGKEIEKLEAAIEKIEKQIKEVNEKKNDATSKKADVKELQQELGALKATTQQAQLDFKAAQMAASDAKVPFEIKAPPSRSTSPNSYKGGATGA